MKIAILTPVYLATKRVIECYEHIDANTKNEFVHVLVDDSSPNVRHINKLKTLANKNRAVLYYHDHVEPEKHRANITKALQMGYDFLGTSLTEFDYLFVVESDVMVPKNWDEDLISLSKLLPKQWMTLDVMPVDDDGEVTYPALKHNMNKGHESHGGRIFEVIPYSDWNAILFSDKVVKALKEGQWRFDEVPSHHDILLSRNFREKAGLEREEWNPATFFRTREVAAVH